MTLPISRLLRVSLFIAGTIFLVWVLKMAFPKNSGALNLLLPLLLLDALLWLDTRQRIGWLPPTWRRIVTLLYWLPLILVLTGVVAGFFSTFYYWPMFVKTYLTSFVLVAYLAKMLPIITLILTWLIRGLVTLVRLITCRTIHPVPRLRGLLYAGWLSGAMVFGLMMAGMVWWQDDFTVKKVEIQLPELPVSFSGYRIVQISDLHLGSWNSRESLETLVTEINTLRPDLVIFTGDLCNYTTEEAWPFQPMLQQISAPDGVLAILGNHDYGDYMVWPSPEAKAQNMDDLVRFYDEMGWRLLRNASVILHRGGDSIAILGVENWGERSRFQRLANLPAALEGVETIPVKLLLTHDPTHWDSIVSQQYPGIGVTFSGHTHGGQVGLEWDGYRWSPAQYFMKHWTGLYSKTHTNGRKQFLYVNPGAGTIGYAGRIGIRPEITLCILI